MVEVHFGRTELQIVRVELQFGMVQFPLKVDLEAVFMLTYS